MCDASSVSGISTAGMKLPDESGTIDRKLDWGACNG
jgi:hypothetical protein